MTLALQSEIDFVAAADPAADDFAAPGVVGVSAESRTWLSCAMLQRLEATRACGGGGCRAGASLACESRFAGDCAFALRAGELDSALSRLPTQQLQALLRLERYSRPAPGREDRPAAWRPQPRPALGD